MCRVGSSRALAARREKVSIRGRLVGRKEEGVVGWRRKMVGGGAGGAGAASRVGSMLALRGFWICCCCCWGVRCMLRALVRFCKVAVDRNRSRNASLGLSKRLKPYPMITLCFVVSITGTGVGGGVGSSRSSLPLSS